MRLLCFAVLLALVHHTRAQQTVPELKPHTVEVLNLSAQGEEQFKASQELYPQVSEKLRSGLKPEQLTPREREALTVSEAHSDYWDPIGDGCSWYCGGGPRSVSASSALKAQGEISYDAAQAHDFSYKTAWAEGVAGYGVGEYLVYTFAPESPRVTEIIVVNGYVKSERAYQDNARVKKLKVYVDDQPYAILSLEDRRSKQYFSVEPIGNGDRADLDKLIAMPSWSLKFEILEVYKGLKYDDVVVSEIYFDGLDVH